MIEKQNIQDHINGRLGTAEEKISELGGITIETIQSKTQGKKRMNKNEQTKHKRANSK